MSIGWRIWFALLIIAALYGLVMIGDVQQAAELNQSDVLGAPQQTVVGVFQVADLVTIIIYELIVGVVAIASLGLLVISRDDRPLDLEEDPPRGAHLREQSEDQDQGIS